MLPQVLNLPVDVPLLSTNLVVDRGVQIFRITFPVAPPAGVRVFMWWDQKNPIDITDILCWPFGDGSGCYFLDKGLSFSSTGLGPAGSTFQVVLDTQPGSAVT